MLGALFERSQLWPLLAAVPVFIAVALALEERRRRRLAEFVDPQRQLLLCPLLARSRRRARVVASSAGLLFMILAVLDPTWGEEMRLVEDRGIDILICADVSRSMLARDIPPTRLERAKRDVEALADHVAGDRLGCVAFAGDARLTIPLTHDRDTFRGLFALLDPTTIRRGGTDLGRAVDAAVEALESGRESVGAHEVILLLTDGEDLEGRGVAAAKRAAEKGITIHCVGFGDTRGSKITIRDDAGEAFLKNNQGQDVVSALDAESLRKVAAETGGEFIRADAMPLPLVELYEKRIAPKAKKTFEAREQSQEKHRFQWPLLAALAIGAAELAARAFAGRRRRLARKALF